MGHDKLFPSRLWTWLVVVLPSCIFAALTLSACKRISNLTSTLRESSADATDSARLYTSVLTELQSDHSDSTGKLWQETSGDLLASGEWMLQTPGRGAFGAKQVAWGDECGLTSRNNKATCDTEFHLQLCQTTLDCANGATCRPMQATVSRPGQTPRSLCVGPADEFVDRIYGVVANAKSNVDIVSLSAPNGRFKVALVNAMAYLSYNPRNPPIRLLFGGYHSAAPSIKTAQSYVNSLVKVLKGKNPKFHLSVALAWFNKASYVSWNHSKIIAADGNHVIEGGQNLWSAEYLGKEPVFDFSLDVTGPAANAAQAFVDTLWELPHTYVGVYPTGSLPGRHANQSTPAQPGTVRMISVARLGAVGLTPASESITGIGMRAANPSDDAIAALFGAAKKRILISQQDMFNNFPTLKNLPPFGIDALADAIGRGVDVTIIKSNSKSASYRMVKAEATFHRLAKYVDDHMHWTGGSSPGGHSDQVCQHLRLATFTHNLRHQAGDTPRLHTKIVIVDDAAFYTGSQNLYPAPLQEFGLMVFDEGATSQLLRDFWDPAWSFSQGQQVFSCANRASQGSADAGSASGAASEAASGEQDGQGSPDALRLYDSTYGAGGSSSDVATDDVAAEPAEVGGQPIDASWPQDELDDDWPETDLEAMDVDPTAKASSSPE